ncbi:YdiU family protein [Aquitalea sp. FJL05]|uniref:protein adenylyltransferase SelO n=1 Tax=Aquitalea sp. FJL05 TaxID=2153366 RepID=UPI000F5B52F6|nr:YdiU family protein [Aquitalea sp. FJL05]RQO73589.1 YdiU family protein [Aquitalea sp. FJL05]
MSPFSSLTFGQRLLELPPVFYRHIQSQPLSEPYLVAGNARLCETLGVTSSELSQPAGLALLSGNQFVPGVPALAALYAGHQFGVYVPQLGDGRALSLGDTVDTAGRRWEWQLKGAGLTPFSRMGDGRAVLRSTIREYLCSEAMHGLGIPTTRALAMTGSPDPVYRERPETAAVLTRLAESFIRFGSFEVFYHRGQHDEIRLLADFVIRHHFPHCADEEQPYAALFADIVARTAQLIAHWQAVGFCHGVMNTDNMSILGLTLDYGPFGFMDGFNAAHVCNHSDHAGRYAYNQQPQVGLWNLHCLASAFLPLVDEDTLLALLSGYREQYHQHWLSLMRAKLGLAESTDDDEALIEALLLAMHAHHTDYTLFFRRLADFEIAADNHALRDLFVDRSLFDEWAARYAARLQLEARSVAERKLAMLAVNPKFILRNYLAEQAIQAAQQGDFALIASLHDCLSHPFDEQPQYQAFAGEPPAWAQEISVSCSS